MESNVKKIDCVDNVVVSSNVLADLFGLTTRWIRQLSEEGVLKKTGRGRYNLQENIKSYIVYLKTNQNLKQEIKDDDELDADIEKALLVRRQREKLDLEIAAIRGTMHFSKDVETVMNDMLANFRAKILAMPTKVAPLLLARDDISEIQQLLQEEFFEALKELASYDPSLFYNEKYIEVEDFDLEEGEVSEETKDSEENN